MTLRRSLAAAAVAALTAAAPAYAESVGSPASLVKKGQWIMSLAGNSIFGRQLNNGAEAQMFGGAHERGYGLTDWLSVYGMIGGAHLSIDDPTIVTSSLSSKHNYGGCLMAGGAVKAKVLQLKGWELTAAGRYVDVRSHRKGKNQVRWHDWLMGGTVAHSFGRTKPYIGATWSIVSVYYKVRDNNQIVAQDRYREDMPIGAVVGTDVYFGESEQVVLNVEAAYQDGPEFNTSIAYVF